MSKRRDRRERDGGELFEVGKRYPGQWRFPMPEITEYNYDVSGHLLRLFWPGAKAEEVAAVRRASAEFALAVEPPMIFLLSRFGDLPWIDCPYNVHLVPEERRRTTLGDPETGAAWNRLEVHLIDGRSGVLKALRAFGLPRDFTDVFETALAEQSRSAWRGRESYDAALSRLYAAMPTSALLARASVRTRFDRSDGGGGSGAADGERDERGAAVGAPDELLARAFGEHMLVRDRAYPRALPEDLARWYCYTLDGGHSVAVLTDQHYGPGIDAASYLVPAPVKSVLRAGYRVVPEGFVVANLAYSPELGLLTDEADSEF